MPIKKQTPKAKARGFILLVKEFPHRVMATVMHSFDATAGPSLTNPGGQKTGI